MDILMILRDLIIRLICALPASIVSFVLRLGVLLFLSTIFLSLGWMYLPSRSVFSQTCVAFLAFIIALYVRVERIQVVGGGIMAFAFLLSVLFMVFLPRQICFWLTPRIGNQLRLCRIIRRIICGLIILQLIVGWM